MAIRPAPDEQGFVLIGAIWLLILAGAIVSVVMMRNITHAQQASHDADNLRNRLALAGAIETVFADRLVNENRSQWWLVPATGIIRVGEMDVSVILSSEGARYDLNEAELTTLDDLMRRYGVDAQDRERIAQTLRNLRLNKRKFRSVDEVDALLRLLPIQKRACLTEQLTIYSGLTSPNRAQGTNVRVMDSTTSSALADTANALRLTVRVPSGLSLSAISRSTIAPHSPWVMSEWRSGSVSAACPN